MRESSRQVLWALGFAGLGICRGLFPQPQQPERRRLSAVLGTSRSRYPAHRIARTEVGDTGVDQGAADQRPPVGGEGQHVRDHSAVREDLRRIADRVDEGFVESPLVDDRSHLGEERGADSANLARMLQTLSLRSTAKSYGWS